MPNEFIYDKNTQRYRWVATGKFLGAEAVQNLTVAKIDQIKTDLDTIGQLLIDRKISLSQWEITTAATIKELHVQMYLLGIGGLANITQRDYGIIGQEMVQQYGFLRGFSEDLINSGMSIDMFSHRLSLYADSARGTFERARQESHIRAGYLWEKRVRTKSNSCQECIDYALQGWQSIGFFPAPTKKCGCKMKCGCYKLFSQSPEPTETTELN